MLERPARFVSNHDGDTVTMLLDQGFRQTVEIDIRLANVWAPELKDPGGPEVLAELVHLVDVASFSGKWPFVVQPHLTRSGKYVMSFGRYVATVKMPDGESLNSKLMRYIVENDFLGGTGAPVRVG